MTMKVMMNEYDEIKEKYPFVELVTPIPHSMAHDPRLEARMEGGYLLKAAGETYTRKQKRDGFCKCFQKSIRLIVALLIVMKPGR